LLYLDWASLCCWISGIGTNTVTDGLSVLRREGATVSDIWTTEPQLDSGSGSNATMRLGRVKKATLSAFDSHFGTGKDGCVVA
jgi:hypothetical protein